jgi:hypothetical protein
LKTLTATLVLLLAGHFHRLTHCLAAEPLVIAVRVPDGGVQPQAAVDARGRLHLIYCQGDPAHGDVFYVHSDDEAASFSVPIRVNSQPGSVVALGTVRGPHLALGRGGRIHVAWNGSTQAEPKIAGRFAPMLYSRLDEQGKSFEPQRNLIHDRPGLDGGGSIAADSAGSVYVAWHAPTVAPAKEADRHVWMVRSTDDGKAFGDEIDLTPDATGACGCCGMCLLANDQGDVFALYRSATQMVHRDMYLIACRDAGKQLSSSKIGPWQIGACTMSTTVMAIIKPGHALLAWEQQGNVISAETDSAGAVMHRVPASGDAANRKHPAVAVTSDGKRLVAWIEGSGWSRGGTLAWEIYDDHGKPLAHSSGPSLSQPAWDLPAVVAIRDGRFLLLY